LNTPVATGTLPLPPVVLANVAQGRLLFNRADFWGCHESLEIAWRVAPDGPRDVIQGLIQAAAAFHKLIVQDNARGAERLLKRSLLKLDDIPDGYLGLAIDPFREELEHWRHRLAGPPVGAGPIFGLPRLTWSPEGASHRLDVAAVELYQVSQDADTVLLVAVDVAGEIGWGECRMARGGYGAWDGLVQALIPALLAEPVTAPSELPTRWLDLDVPSTAKAGLEAALWDVWARRLGLGLPEALGFAARPVLLAGRAAAAELAELSEEVAGLVAAGYHHLIIPARPNADRRVLPAVALRCPVPFTIDLGEAYRMADIQVLVALEGLSPALLSRPFPVHATAESARLARLMTAPVSLGPWEHERALASALSAGALDVVELDPR
jgi:hypothetical protein